MMKQKYSVGEMNTKQLLKKKEEIFNDKICHLKDLCLKHKCKTNVFRMIENDKKPKLEKS